MKKVEHLSELDNLGEIFAARLEAVGVDSPKKLRDLGAVKAYRLVKAAFPKETSLTFLYALQGALWDVHWNSLPMDVREKLRKEALSIIG